MANAELQSLTQQRAAKDEAVRQKRVMGAKRIHYIGILMLIASLGLLITSSLFLVYVKKTENMVLGSIPIGLFAAAVGIAGGLCEYCASRTLVEQEGKGCSRSLVIVNFVMSFVAVGQCVMAAAFAGVTYSTCMEDPGPVPDESSWFSLDFRQCVTYRSEVKASAVFLIIFGIALGVMSVASIVVYCMYKSVFGIVGQHEMFQQVERGIATIQHIFNMQAQYPDRNTCSSEELQQLQGHITELQTELTEAAAVPQRQNAGAPIRLMNLQAQVTALQQALNTHIQMSRRPQQPVYPFQTEVSAHGYPGYPLEGQGQPMYYAQGQGQLPHQGQPMPYSHGEAHPMDYIQGSPVQHPLLNNPQEGQGQHVHHPQDHKQGQVGGQLPPSYETVMAKGHDADTEKNWV